MIFDIIQEFFLELYVLQCIFCLSATIPILFHDIWNGWKTGTRHAYKTGKGWLVRADEYTGAVVRLTKYPFVYKLWSGRGFITNVNEETFDSN